ncbi:flagellar motor protein MotA [Acidisoma cellulosilytica]|uniref:Flagellar motor protein MotA n=1 Tax=Acidisoma cellulosilyticum TaxID=2802395 RepID=A0A963YY32_9PROT|nr:flagellar motor protein MotA [Acidisoma cellulosilyticum]MCB8879070.1 flagellar motor protein MotA [Acidisoma cellulosilyticum]
MTRPTSYLIRMLIFLAAVSAVAIFLIPKIRIFFASNPALNSFIFFVMLLGIIWNLRQVQRLGPEVTWVGAYQRSRQKLMGITPPKLLAPMARMLAARADAAGREGRVSISTQAMRSLLDGIGSRLDESREISRYATALMIFLGLLGTFWGLLRTVSAVADVIQGMSVGGGDINAVFDQLKSGLAGPLAGMSTAFSSSMFGLAGALVLGFLDLQAGQAQNRFYNELEDWLAGFTRLSSGVLGGEGEGGNVPAYVQALLEQTAENMEGLQTVLTRGEEGRAQSSQVLGTLADRLNTFTDTMRANQQLMLRIAESQQALAPALQRLADTRDNRASDEIAHAHLRNIEHALQRLIAESEQGRAQSTSELRNELRVLARTVAALGDGAR